MKISGVGRWQAGVQGGPVLASRRGMKAGRRQALFQVLGGNYLLNLTAL